MKKFLADYETGKKEERYLLHSLPNLDLSDNQFEVCLCSHFLFLYSEQRSTRLSSPSSTSSLRVSKRWQPDVEN